MPARTGFTLLNRVPCGKFNRVKVNIPDKFLQIGIFLADNGFVTILKQLAVALVAAIKTDGIASKKPSHYRSKGDKSRSK